MFEYETIYQVETVKIKLLTFDFTINILGERDNNLEQKGKKGKGSVCGGGGGGGGGEGKKYGERGKGSKLEH